MLLDLDPAVLRIKIRRTYHPDADTDSDFYLMRIWIFIADPDPTFHPDADPYPDPSIQIKAQTLEKVLK
jgi:hypothetical protein